MTYPDGHLGLMALGREGSDLEVTEQLLDESARMWLAEFATHGPDHANTKQAWDQWTRLSCWYCEKFAICRPRPQG